MWRMMLRRVAGSGIGIGWGRREGWFIGAGRMGWKARGEVWRRVDEST